jgi:hypothetical protein
MKAVRIKELKDELTSRSHEEILDFCLRLSKYKKENKELLTYLLFESFDESLFVENVKSEIDSQFELINKTNYYFIKKSVRKILVFTKKYIKFSKQKETEIDLLIYFCTKLKSLSPSIKYNTRLLNLYNGQTELIRKKVSMLHEDLQFDYGIELNKLNENFY